MHIDPIISKLETKQATVGVIGLGYVGLPLALSFVEKGFRTIGFAIVTFDSDFYERGLIHGFPPKVLWLRYRNTSTQMFSTYDLCCRSEIY